MPDDKTDVPYDAPWVKDMKHSRDPNHVRSLQVPQASFFDPAGPGQKLPPSGAVSVRTRSLPVLHDTDLGPANHQPEPSYYNVPILQNPTWKWQIALYFYLGGLSAGAYLLSRAAERFGSLPFRGVARWGSVIALAGILPGPPLLIADLGDPKRFHHMLRVWKPSTPMNLGTWAISFYSGHVAFDAVRRFLVERGAAMRPAERSRLVRLMNHGALLAVHDAAGVPLALLVSSYTGVLLSCTSNPLWCKNPYLAPMFAASALATGAEAIGLALDLFPRASSAPARKMLARLDTAAHAAEFACMKGFTATAGEKAAPLTSGSMKKHHVTGISCIVAGEVLKHLPVRPRYRRALRIAANALGLVGGFSMRWGIVMGGHPAAADPHLSRAVSRPAKPPANSSGASARRASGQTHPHTGAAR